MSGTIERETVNEALGVVDQGLGRLLHRELVSANEAADLLLDVRSLLARALEDLADEEVLAVPVGN
jgi:hypothetical protein